MSYWVLIVHSGIDTRTSRSYKFLFLSDFAYFVPTVATFCILCLFEYFFLVVVIKVVITSAVDYVEKPLSKMSYYHHHHQFITHKGSHKDYKKTYKNVKLSKQTNIQ